MAKVKRRYIATKNKTIGYGYVGRWSDGNLGLCLPEQLGYGTNDVPPKEWNENREVELCKITIEPSPRPNGTPVRKTIPQLKPMTDKDKIRSLLWELDVDFDFESVSFENPTRRVHEELRISVGGCNKICIGLNEDGSMQYMDTEHGC